MRLSLFAISLFLTLTASCSGERPIPNTESPDLVDTEQARSWMIGNWVGKNQLADGGERVWLIERAVDGTFKVTFLKYSGFDVRESQEVGYWGIRRDVYFTITTGYYSDGEMIETDLTSPKMYDAYDILRLNENSFEYQSKIDGTIFLVRKVDETYKLPDTFGTQGFLCERGHRVEHILEAGRVVILEDESAWAVTLGDDYFVADWRPFSQITICRSMIESRMINADHYYRASVTRIE